MSDGQVVLVTGATGGIGRAVALAYAARGARLVLTSRSEQSLKDLVAACERRGGTALEAVVDVTDASAVQGAVRVATDGFGRLDVVVHTAAVVAYGRLSQVPAEVWDRALEVNVRGTANVARAALGEFEPAAAGHLVIIGSLLGQVAVPYMGAYVSSKWAVHGMVRALQQESRATPGVHIALITPGGIDTPIYGNAATYVGRPGTPPPPVLGPEAVAHQVLRAVDLRLPAAAAGPANGLVRLGFALLPRVYDTLVEPLFLRLGLADQAKPSGEGNLFEPTEAVEA